MRKFQVDWKKSSIIFFKFISFKKNLIKFFICFTKIGFCILFRFVFCLSHNKVDINWVSNFIGKLVSFSFRFSRAIKDAIQFFVKFSEYNWLRLEWGFLMCRFIFFLTWKKSIWFLPGIFLMNSPQISQILCHWHWIKKFPRSL